MFDAERYGRLLTERPETIPAVFQEWVRLRKGTIPEFSAWVQDVTGYGLGDLLDPGQRDALLAALSPDANLEASGPDDAGLMIFEGMESGP